MSSSSSVSRSGRYEAIDRLSRPPVKGWPDGAVHHGSRILLVLAVAAAVTLFFPPATGLQVSRYEVGMVADEDIIASVPFGVPKSVEELGIERAAAASAVPPTFRLHPEGSAAMEAALSSFFDQVEAATREPNPGDALDEILTELGISTSPEQRSLLQDAGVRGTLESAALQAVRELLPQGVMTETPGVDPTSSGRILVVSPGGGERYIVQDSVLTSSRFYDAASGFLPANTGSQVDELLRLALIRFMDETLQFDAAATGTSRMAARRAVPMVKANVLQGEAIVRANQQLGEAEVERLRAYEEALRTGGLLESGPRFAGVAGSVVLNILLIALFGTFLLFFREDVYKNFRWLVLLGVLILAFTGVGGLVARNGLPPELLPIAFVSLTTAVLWDGRLALALAVTLAALVGAQGPFQTVNAWLPVFVAGSAAALSVRAVRRRAQTWIFIAVIVLAYSVVFLTLGLISGRGIELVGTSLAWASGNAVVSAILAMGFLPVFEWFTRITTDQTLLEWADPNRPLLRRLSMEAPGTYAHAINMANLAEAAANGIGANGLLCRVGVYYHDVGKILKPQYFVENQPAGRNPHDRLKPATSAAIVREHVTEGIRLAQEAKLPDVLVDFIPEHHGTQEISFFYRKAVDEAGGEGALRDEDFRYPGPKPRSKETAIVMLADAVESAARALQDPTPERVRGLIDGLVDDRIRRGQLDEAPLTLGEIGVIKAQFQTVLAGLYHHRIDYPTTRHLTEASGEAPPEPPAGGSAAAEVASTAGTVPAPGSFGKVIGPPAARSTPPSSQGEFELELPAGPAGPPRGQGGAMGS
jgi:putative nucleotidyltransferase with HDIG domain